MTWSGEDWDLTNMNKAMLTVQNQIQKYFNQNRDKYDKLKDPKIKKDFDIRIQKYYNLYYEEFEDETVEPSKERIEQFQLSVNNDYIQFFQYVRNDVKNNFDNIKNNIIIEQTKKITDQTPVNTKKSRGRPKKLL